jgi:hypothetical protein
MALRDKVDLEGFCATRDLDGFARQGGSRGLLRDKVDLEGFP